MRAAIQSRDGGSGRLSGGHQLTNGERHKRGLPKAADGARLVGWPIAVPVVSAAFTFHVRLAAVFLTARNLDGTEHFPVRPPRARGQEAAPEREANHDWRRGPGSARCPARYFTRPVLRGSVWFGLLRPYRLHEPPE